MKEEIIGDDYRPSDVSEKQRVKELIDVWYARWEKLPSPLKAAINIVAGELFTRGVNVILDQWASTFLNARNTSTRKVFESEEDKFDKDIWDMDEVDLSSIVSYLNNNSHDYPEEFCSKFYEENQERIRERLILE